MSRRRPGTHSRTRRPRKPKRSCCPSWWLIPRSRARLPGVPPTPSPTPRPRWTWTGGWPGFSSSAAAWRCPSAGWPTRSWPSRAPILPSSSRRTGPSSTATRSAASIWTWKARPCPTPRPFSGVQWPSPRSSRSAARGQPLSVWLTLPADPNGLTATGSDAVQKMIAAGVDLTGVNAMTMDYGGKHAAGPVDVRDAVSAAEATRQQLTGLYRAAGTELGTGTVWRKVGLTPMIGQNDVAGEIFTLKDARNSAPTPVPAASAGFPCGPLNRDRTCGPNYEDLTGFRSLQRSRPELVLRRMLGGDLMACPSVRRPPRHPDSVPGRHRRSLDQPVPDLVRKHGLSRRGEDRLALERLRGQMVDPRRYPG